jgi:hypothetical protein
MGNRVLQAKMVKIAKAKAIKRGHLKRWDVSKLRDGRPRVRADQMHDYHGTINGRDDEFVKQFGLDNPKQESRKAVLAIRDKLAKDVSVKNWIVLRPGYRLKVFLCWRVYHDLETNKARGMEYFIIHHDILLGLVKRSVVFDSSASAMAAFNRGFVAYEFQERYIVDTA